VSLAELQRQREAATVVHEIVSAMRAMAAGRVQGAQRALVSARSYYDTIQRGLQSVGPDHPLLADDAAVHREVALVIVTSEQGLCGAFNQNILARAQQRWEELPPTGRVHLFVVGRTGLLKVRALGMEPEAVHPAATAVRGLRDVVKGLTESLAERYAAGHITSMEVVYSRYQSVTQQVPTSIRVLPLKLDSSASQHQEPTKPFLHYLPLPALVTGLVREYLFIALYRVVAESFASEQASRLVAMDAATRHTADFLDELRRRERKERQNEITRQVLELTVRRKTELENPAESDLPPSPRRP
jgi:F-type H+-transporting ATPase subunit gamma